MLVHYSNHKKLEDDVLAERDVANQWRSLESPAKCHDGSVFRSGNFP